MKYNLFKIMQLAISRKNAAMHQTLRIICYNIADESHYKLSKLHRRRECTPSLHKQFHKGTLNDFILQDEERGSWREKEFGNAFIIFDT